MAIPLVAFARSHPLLALFVLAYTAGFTVLALASGNSEFIFYAIVMVVLIGGVFAVHNRVGFTTPILWGLGVWGLLHMAGGNVPIPAGMAVDWTPPDGPGPHRTVLYNMRLVPWMPKFDQFVHAFGFFMATLATFQALRAAAQPAIRVGSGLIIAAAIGGMGLGALNEVVEFAATRFMETNVGGYENTGWDLVSNLTGCVLAAILLAAGFGRSDQADPQGRD
jgi:hypothetical protein